jgi:hypothetical protein
VRVTDVSDIYRIPQYGRSGLGAQAGGSGQMGAARDALMMCSALRMALGDESKVDRKGRCDSSGTIRAHEGFRTTPAGHCDGADNR